MHHRQSVDFHSPTLHRDDSPPADDEVSGAPIVDVSGSGGEFNFVKFHPDVDPRSAPDLSLRQRILRDDDETPDDVDDVDEQDGEVAFELPVAEAGGTFLSRLETAAGGGGGMGLSRSNQQQEESSASGGPASEKQQLVVRRSPKNVVVEEDRDVSLAVPQAAADDDGRRSELLLREEDSDDDEDNPFPKDWSSLSKERREYRELTDALAKRPGDTKLLMKRAKLCGLWWQIAQNEAIRDYTEVIRLDPQNAEAFLGRAEVYRRQSHYSLAIPDYTEYIRLKPTDPKGYAERAIALGRNREYYSAIRDYTKALRIGMPSRRKQRQLEIARTELYVEVGDFDSALQTSAGLGQNLTSEMDDRVWLVPSHHPVSSSWGNFVRRLGCRGLAQYYQHDTDFGLADFLEDLSLSIFKFFPLMRVAMALMHQNRFLESVRYIQKAIQYRTGSDELLLPMKSLILARMGNWRDAGKSLVEARSMFDWFNLDNLPSYIARELRFFPDSVATLRDIVFAMSPSSVRDLWISVVQKYYSPCPTAATHVGLAPKSLRSVLPAASSRSLGPIEVFEDESEDEAVGPLRAVDEAEAVLQRLDDKKERRQLKRALLLLLSQSGVRVRLRQRSRVDTRCALANEAWRIVTHSAVLGGSRWSLLFDHSRDRCFCWGCLHRRGEDLRKTVRVTNGSSHGIPTGWTEFGLSISEYSLALGCLTDWHVAFHGTTIVNAAAIVKTGAELLMPGDVTLTGKRLKVREGHIGHNKPEKYKEHAERLYVTKSVVYALKYYCQMCQLKGQKYQVMFRVRIAPGSYKEIPETIGATKRGVWIDPDFRNSELEWTTDRRSAICVVGLLLRKVPTGPMVL